jgi:hypothetical protein
MMMKAFGCLFWLILLLSGANGKQFLDIIPEDVSTANGDVGHDGGFEKLDRTSNELGTYLGVAVEATDDSALERYHQAINVFGECLQEANHPNDMCLVKLEHELENLDMVFTSGIVFAHDLVREGLAMNVNAIHNRMQWLNRVDTAEVELLEDTQGLLEEQAHLIDNTINVVGAQREFSVDCEVEGVKVNFSDEDFEGIQVSFEAIINMAFVRNGMDDYVSNFSWDGAAERKQTVRNLRLSRLFGTGYGGCRNCRASYTYADRRKMKNVVSEEVMLENQRDNQIKALESKFKWKEDSQIDSIANPKVCLAGESLNFVNDPLAYLITAKLGVDVTDNESFSLTCCFHFDV